MPHASTPTRGPRRQLQHIVPTQRGPPPKRVRPSRRAPRPGLGPVPPVACGGGEEVGCGLAPPRAEGSGWSRLPLPAPNPPPPMPDLRGDDPIHGKEDRICHLHTRKTVGQCRLLHHCWYRRGERERENCAEEVELLTTAVHVAAGHTAAHSGSGEAGMGLGRCWWWRGRRPPESPVWERRGAFRASEIARVRERISFLHYDLYTTAQLL
jgi:hypothetical protein